MACYPAESGYEKIKVVVIKGWTWSVTILYGMAFIWVLYVAKLVLRDLSLTLLNQ